MTVNIVANKIFDSSLTANVAGWLVVLVLLGQRAWTIPPMNLRKLSNNTIGQGGIATKRDGARTRSRLQLRKPMGWPDELTWSSTPH
jgi:hypothetical protein